MLAWLRDGGGECEEAEEGSECFYLRSHRHTHLSLHTLSARSDQKMLDVKLLISAHLFRMRVERCMCYLSQAGRPQLQKEMLIDLQEKKVESQSKKDEALVFFSNLCLFTFFSHTQ